MQPARHLKEAVQADKASQPDKPIQTDYWHTLTKPQGQKLHILNPSDYTKEELKWLAKKFKKGTNNGSGQPDPTETTAPKDPRTAVIDSINLLATQQLKQDPNAQVPKFVQREFQRVEAEWEQDRAEGFWKGSGLEKMRAAVTGHESEISFRAAVKRQIEVPLVTDTAMLILDSSMSAAERRRTEV